MTKSLLYTYSDIIEERLVSLLEPGVYYRIFTGEHTVSIEFRWMYLDRPCSYIFTMTETETIDMANDLSSIKSLALLVKAHAMMHGAAKIFRELAAKELPRVFIDTEVRNGLGIKVTAWWIKNDLRHGIEYWIAVLDVKAMMECRDLLEYHIRTLGRWIDNYPRRISMGYNERDM